MVDDSLVKNFKDNLNALLKERGITISSLSRATGISKATLSQWTSGTRPTLDESVVRLARFLGVSVERLITGREPEEDLIADVLENADDGFVTLHKGVYRVKLEKFSGKFAKKVKG